jgi:hypothetical protein
MPISSRDRESGLAAGRYHEPSLDSPIRQVPNRKLGTPGARPPSQRGFKIGAHRRSVCQTHLRRRTASPSVNESSASVAGLRTTGRWATRPILQIPARQETT